MNVGQTVWHEKFGLGRVLSVMKFGIDEVNINVEFSDGVKTVRQHYLVSSDVVLPKKPGGKALQILSLLEQACEKGCSNTELAPISFRYSAYIGKLRELGHEIETIRVDCGAGNWKYILHPPSAGGAQ